MGDICPHASTLLLLYTAIPGYINVFIWDKWHQCDQSTV